MTFFIVRGEIPEMMGEDRLLDYASNILDANRDEYDFPQRFANQRKITTRHEAISIINWFGEQVQIVEC